LKVELESVLKKPSNAPAEPEEEVKDPANKYSLPAKVQEKRLQDWLSNMRLFK